MRRNFIILIILAFPHFANAQENGHQTGTIGITFSFPWTNNYSYYDYDSLKSLNKSGFSGFGGSIFYKSQKNKYSLNIGLTGDLPAPIGAFDYAPEGTRTNISSFFGELNLHRKINHKINLIAGLNFVGYQFNFKSYVDSLPSYSRFDKTLGLTVGTEYILFKNLSLALFYRPAIISFDRKQYRHLISLDARFDLNLWYKNK